MKQALGVLSGVVLGVLASWAAGGSGSAEILPRALAQGGPSPGGAGGIAVVSTGGGTPNQNDLCWVLAKVKPARGPERLVLSMYRAKRNGECFDLEDVRMIDADLRVIELKGESHTKTTTVEEILKKLPREEREAILPPRNP